MWWIVGIAGVVAAVAAVLALPPEVTRVSARLRASVPISRSFNHLVEVMRLCSNPSWPVDLGLCSTKA
jgi:hypothetical protein